MGVRQKGGGRAGGVWAVWLAPQLCLVFSPESLSLPRSVPQLLVWARFDGSSAKGGGSGRRGLGGVARTAALPGFFSRVPFLASVSAPVARLGAL